ncbi:HAD-IC family P-type ATPase [Roseofilum capinflatum]|uniref:HAD-IC family P-type ATPase n=1 Tax=Roseofilum capinflatum BLCC-M114 TaxID=3022440 RepID=A0ABT7BBV3_9CYAN|nr:HAD-IC family P-type ATPase [Roseofilum capinflatum]MDJ1176650.1 HAD-IC family P-type ATPase [Roseofilum capinflatum BLCC-M114]
MVNANSILTGLTDEQVKDRYRSGLHNDVNLPNSRSYQDILGETVFTFINGVFFSIFMLLISLGRYSDGAIVIVVLFSAVIVSVCQEIWAKRKLDKVALLTRPRSLVMRNGQECTLDPREIVQGDVLHLVPGEQIMVDGEVLQGQMEVDESLLTGESDAIVKKPGDRLLSGTFCISGNGYYEAQQVGRETLAYRLASGARAVRQVYTPLQQQINLVIRIFILVAGFLWILVAIAVLSRTLSVPDGVQKAAVISSLVPAGLYLSITLAYALGAVRMLDREILIQQANSVESLSHVDILCLDKTGTLTANQIEVHQLEAIQEDRARLEQILGGFAASATTQNATSEAIARYRPHPPQPVNSEVPFTSARKWSGCIFATGEIQGTYVLGAPDILARTIPLAEEIRETIHQWTEQGYRVLLFAGSEAVVSLYDGENTPTIPPTLAPLGLVILGDQLRPGVLETLQGFQQAGVQLKIISGDYPQTVQAIARQVGLEGDLAMISGAELAQIEPHQWPQVVQDYTIFGRITPDQKAQLVKELRQKGIYVAMIGDGVNDVLSLKQANLGIAMESGSKATKAVADLVLLKDSFVSLPFAFLEGQRIQNGIQDVLKLFIIRIFSFTLLILATGQVIGTFPLLNKHSALVTALSVGFPSMSLPVYAKPGGEQSGDRVRALFRFILPATLSVTLAGLIVYLGYLVTSVWRAVSLNGMVIIDNELLAIPRSALVTLLILCGLTLMLFLKPPTRFWVAVEPLSGDWRYTAVALSLLGLYSLILAIAPVRAFFDLTLLSVSDYAFILAIVLLWMYLLRLTWRRKWLERFLGKFH